MFGLSIWELLIVLAIVILLFGPRRLKTIGSDLGTAIKGFRTAIKDDSDAPAEALDGVNAKAEAEAAKQKPNV